VTEKTEIIIHAWHVWESSGGFEWAPTTSFEDVEALTNAHHEAVSIFGATSSTLCTLKVAGYSATDQAARQSITDFIDGELQDAIEIGVVGHILGKFSVEPVAEFGWWDFDLDESDYIEDKYILTIINPDGDEIATIVHRTVGGKHPLDGEVAELKRAHARRIVELLNTHGGIA
jgi:hypothetical protein